MKRALVLLGTVALAALSAIPVQATTMTVDGISLQQVYNMNNPADSVKDPAGHALGSVSYAYAIGTYEVTNNQYVAFLNAVGKTTVDADYLLDGNNPDLTYNNGTGLYTTTVGNQPVRYVVWADEARYVNWLTNGQQTGGAGIDTGTYAVTSGTLVTSNMKNSPKVYCYTTRGAVSNGSWAVASEDEWYKAAYYSGSGSTYFSYPTTNNTAPTASTPPGTNNSANLNNVSVPTNVGAYVGSGSGPTISPYGCYDMAGNVNERTDTLLSTSSRRPGGGSDWDDSVANSKSTFFNTYSGFVDENSYNDMGFRVVLLIPEPGTLSLLATGLIGLLCYGWRRRRTLHKLSPLTLKMATVALVAMTAGVTQANVFDMGGTRNPTTGTWTGSASLEFVTVGDPGNSADTVRMQDGTTGYGSVPYTYQMGKYDVTVGQYCQFLNAVAKTDTYGLYHSVMATDYPTVSITQSGSPGNYSYSVTGSYDQGVNCPIFDVTWGDAARFCNWLQNGQPTTLGEVAGSTETGAYTLNGNSNLSTVTRNSAVTYFLPTENEWYKAAYYKGGTTNAGYWFYPTQSNTTPPGNTLPDVGHSANFASFSLTDPTNCLTPVGAFSASPGPYGTFDMGGDVYQWNEAIFGASRRESRGGVWFDGAFNLDSSHLHSNGPTTVLYGFGFRVASVPEPGSITLVIAGGLCLLAFAWRRKRRAA